MSESQENSTPEDSAPQVEAPEQGPDTAKTEVQGQPKTSGMTKSGLLGNLKRRQSKFRWSISIKIYLALATFVLLIMLASLLGWGSIWDMNSIQKTITQQRIPELTLAIKMGQESVALMNTAP